VKIGGVGSVEGFNRPNMTTKRPGGSDSASGEFSLAPKSSESSKQKSPAKINERDEQRESLAGASAGVAPSVSQPVSTKSAETKAVVERAAPQGPSVAQAGKSTDSTKASQSEFAERSQAPGTAGRPTEVASAVEPIATDSVEASTQSALNQVIQDMAAELGVVQNIEQEARNGSMHDFLKQMKSEFGVEPERIIKAFAELTPEKLQASPEASMSDVLKSLGLKSEEMPKAERIYRQMLNTTGESALNETLAGVGAGVSLKVMSESELAFNKLQKSITDLNDSFAIRNQTPAQPADSVQSLSRELILDGASEVSDQSIEQKESSTRDISAALKAALNSVSKETGVTSELGVAQVAATAKAASVDQRKSESLEAVLKEASSAAPQAPGFVLPDQGKSAVAGTASATFTMMPQAEGAVKENAQEVIRNAQLLLQKGGGEMKMQLKPEGVGEVHLKVQVKDGQVAVQMLTESDSAKKLLESGLDDLKTTLAASKLHVDALKIEVGTEMAKQRFEQSQQDASREQARQTAQDFMGQFRQDREAFRQGFTDGSGLRSYGAPRRPAPPEMEGVTASGSNGKASSSRRLDLVA
jgi:flagellar hook-length control protein FliK